MEITQTLCTPLIPASLLCSGAHDSHALLIVWGITYESEKYSSWAFRGRCFSWILRYTSTCIVAPVTRMPQVTLEMLQKMHPIKESIQSDPTFSQDLLCDCEVQSDHKWPSFSSLSKDLQYYIHVWNFFLPMARCGILRNKWIDVSYL